MGKGNNCIREVQRDKLLIAADGVHLDSLFQEGAQGSRPVVHNFEESPSTNQGDLSRKQEYFPI